MSELENMEAVELSMDEMNEVSGGKFSRPNPKNGYVIYQIQKGETLGRIATKFGVTVNNLLKWNPKITDRNKIYYGDYLYIKA